MPVADNIPNQKPNLVVLAAGGTGGHIFPAASVAEELRHADIAACLITDKRGQAFSNIPTHRILAGSPNRRGLGPFGKLWTIAKLGIGSVQSFYLMLRLRPDVVVGFGGYAAAPTIFAAYLLHIPIIMHEQNAVLGRTNRLFSRFAKFIATSFPTTDGLTLNQLRKSVFTGNPVRSEIAKIADDPYPPASTDGKLRLLITGGSQGAHIFGWVIPQAVELLPQSLRDKLFISQQCREEDKKEVIAAYDRIKVSAEIEPFFTDMASRIGKAHLVIMRAGASTVAELTAAGRPSILVPYLHALDNHQMINARALADKSAAWLMPQDAFQPEALAARLESYLTLPETLTATAHNAKELGVRDAAKRLVRLITKTHQLHRGIIKNKDPQEEFGAPVLGEQFTGESGKAA